MMNDEEQRGYMQNCSNGLRELDKMLNSMLEDDNSKKDEKLLETKRQVEKQIGVMDAILDGHPPKKM